MAEGSVTHFAPDGDLNLDIGENGIARFIVDSNVLTRASQVFKAMLRGGLAESQTMPGCAWVVSLPEDDPKALAILLCIMHFRFDELPATVSVVDLFNITVLSNKYDLTFLKPWAKNWIASLPDRQPGEAIAPRLWIAWELGSQSDFEKTLDDLVRECSLDFDRNLCDGSGERLDDYPVLIMTDVLGKLLAKVHLIS
jgi:hypothetical protein